MTALHLLWLPILLSSVIVFILSSLIHPVLEVLFRKYVCTLEELGLSMINVTEKGFAKKILECEDIGRLASSGASRGV